MGLLKAVGGAAGSTLGDQWKEYFVCDSMDADVLVTKGRKKVSGRSSNTKGSENVISTGSVIAVNAGQCMLIVEQGKVAEVCCEPGEFIYDASTEPSIFVGDLGQGIKDVFAMIGKRFTFGGETPKDQRVYFVNLKELTGNKYGTPNPVPFRVVDTNIGLDADIAIRCFGEYSYKITNPVLFYTNVCGNVTEDYTRDQIEGQLKSELLTALQPAFARISSMGVRYSALPGHTMEIADALNEILTAKWADLRGIEIAAFGISSVSASEEDEKMIKELQRTAVFRNPTMAAAQLTGAQAAAMQAAASNSGAGPAMAFMGMNMAANAGGINAGDLFAMGQKQEQERTAAQAAQTSQVPQGNQGSTQEYKSTWDCSCGHTGNTGKFCVECGSPRPQQNAWICPSCGTANKGKFCMECGTKKPPKEPLYRCDKCGWEPEDPRKPPKFCPECGDPFNDEDMI
ncbi:MAG: SPFH domain-containing protein [Clostridiales bacterium]|nr:SPFH domain-containing protein [Clostridiales bacterium]